MENGKPVGVRCIHLAEDYSCDIFDSPDRPDVRAGFMPETEFCGSSREDAKKILTMLEQL